METPPISFSLSFFVVMPTAGGNTGHRDWTCATLVTLGNFPFPFLYITPLHKKLQNRELTFTLMEVYRNMVIWPWPWPWPDLHGQLPRTKDSISRSLQQLTIPLFTFPIKGLSWKTLRSLYFLGHEPPVSLHRLAINFSLLQTLMFQFYLVSLWVRYMDLLLVTILVSRPGVCGYIRLTSARSNSFPESQELPEFTSLQGSQTDCPGLAPAAPTHEAIWS